VDHGEDPAQAVVREVAEETGLAVAVVRVRDVTAELVARPPYLEHTDGVLYDLAPAQTAPPGRDDPAGVPAAASLRPEVDGSSDRAEWVPLAEAAKLPLSRFAAQALGLPLPSTITIPAGPSAPRTPRPRRGQRFAVYGLVTDPAGRVLLTLNAAGYPGAGRWHLPGGGTDFGEQPRDGLLREITEESGQQGRITGLLAVGHHHNRAAFGPEGYPIDWHGVRAVFRVVVATPTTPQVLDVGGSTAEAGWFSRAEAAALPLNELTTGTLASAHP
jgi:ADP-ribose pyrophosphatase YjhB (NUDIX family)